MKRSHDLSRLPCLLAWVALASPSLAQDVQQKIAAAKQAAAQNQQALRSYTWIEKTEISLKGEVKNTSLQACRYGPDGKVQKTPLSEPAPPQEKSGRQGRLKARVVEKKKGEMKEEMQAASALVHQYVPPSPEKMQAAMAAGRVTITPGAGTAGVRIADYEKAGDSLVLTLDGAAKAMKKIDVDTWLDAPTDKVTLDVQMQSLPDGPSYPGTVVLAIPGSQIQVQITNSNYQKVSN